jgi:SNF2-related domain/Helicase conserved C-terminal domain
MEIVDNRALRIRTRNPDKYRIIPKHHITPIDGGFDVLVHWGLDECKVLRNLGVKDVPAPIAKNYTWPGKYKPMAHQRVTAGFVTMHPRCFVLNEAGTSKTISVLWAADYLMNLKKVRRCLVVCPLSIMHSAWMGDIHKSVLHRSAAIAHHAQVAKRVEIIKGDYEIVIINYDGLNLVADDIKKDGRFDLVIVDEATSYSVATTRRWKSLNKILGPDTLLWMMTGTPAAQSPLHAYGLAKLVNPSGVPAYFTGWRDMVMHKLTMFKWVPKSNAKDMVYNALQPAVRFTKAQCLDLPPVTTQTREVAMTAQQNKYYKMIKDQMLATAAGETITAVNKAVVVSKLLQISCIAYNTDVLTDRGWVPIEWVRKTDRVWDGVEWVSHEGLLYKGNRAVVSCAGVLMTAEHRVLTTAGWRTAKEIVDGESSNKFGRAKVRLPYRASAWRGFRRGVQESTLGMFVRLWEGGGTGEPVSADATQDTPSQLRVPPRERDTQDVKGAPIPHLDAHAQALYGQHAQGLQKLWRTGYRGLQKLGRFLRGFLGGYGSWLRPGTYTRAHPQQPWVQCEKLPVGDTGAAEQQHASQSQDSHVRWGGDCYTSGAASGDAQRHTGGASAQRVDAFTRSDGASTAAPQDVFDLVNCGPRNRFVVRSEAGEMLIVHNCGAAYSDDKDIIEFDAAPRMNVLDEILNETERKVIVFALFRSSIDAIYTYLTKQGHAVDVIHGGVSPSKRGAIVNAFQSSLVDLKAVPDAATREALNAVRAKTMGPRVLVMQPQATAHGLTLTAADTVVFFGPLMSVEQYVQCIARADRQGQTADKVTVIHIQSSPIEKKMFEAMDRKVEDHALLTEMFDSEVKGA